MSTPDQNLSDKKPFWRAVKLATECEGNKEKTERFVTEARKVKEQIGRRFTELNRELAVLNTLVQQVTPEAEWDCHISWRQGMPRI